MSDGTSFELTCSLTDDELRERALPLMEQALQMIDRVNCPGAALLDLAIVRIKEDLGYVFSTAAE